MNTKTKQVENKLLSPQFAVLANQVALPAPLALRQQSVPVKSVAPEFQARRERTRLEAQRRGTQEHARQEQERRMREQRATRQATFKVD